MSITNLRNDAPLWQTFRAALAGSGSAILRGSAETDPVLDFACATSSGLKGEPRRLESRFLYDERGSRLFEEITRQPEYYLTRAEAVILAASARRIREITGPLTLVELGSGSSIKTDYLLREWVDRQPIRYVPVDVSASALDDATRSIQARNPAVQVIGVHSQYADAFPLLSHASPVMAVFLGSSIGNFAPAEMYRFIRELSSSLNHDDFFLLGVDLVKERHVLEAAYNDAAGVTAEFTRNLFVRMNRELESGIDLSVVEHLATYNDEKEQIEIFARFREKTTIRVTPLGERFTVEAGEMIGTEISRKFRLEKILPFIERFGFSTEEVFMDDRQRFALLLFRRGPVMASGTA